MADARKLARIFKALSVDTRVRIVQLLKKRALCVNALAERLGVSAPAVSQHLRLLRDADLVTPDRRGCRVHYELNRATLQRWQAAASKLLEEETDRKERK